jgi:hypothetical protein
VKNFNAQKRGVRTPRFATQSPQNYQQFTMVLHHKFPQPPQKHQQSQALSEVPPCEKKNNFS